jgi:hypothetical protein
LSIFDIGEPADPSVASAGRLAGEIREAFPQPGIHVDPDLRHGTLLLVATASGDKFIESTFHFVVRYALACIEFRDAKAAS